MVTSCEHPVTCVVKQIISANGSTQKCSERDKRNKIVSRLGCNGEAESTACRRNYCLPLPFRSPRKCLQTFLVASPSVAEEREGIWAWGRGDIVTQGRLHIPCSFEKKKENRTYCSILQVWFELSGVRCVPLERRFKTWSAIYERPLVSSPAKGGRR